MVVLHIQQKNKITKKKSCCVCMCFCLWLCLHTKLSLHIFSKLKKGFFSSIYIVFFCCFHLFISSRNCTSDKVLRNISAFTLAINHFDSHELISMLLQVPGSKSCGLNFPVYNLMVGEKKVK